MEQVKFQDSRNRFIAYSGNSSIWRIYDGENLVVVNGVVVVSALAQCKYTDADNEFNVVTNFAVKFDPATGLIKTHSPYFYNTGWYVRSVAIDSSGNVYAGTNRGVLSGYKTITKISPSGTLVWDYDNSSDATYSLKVDGSGNVYAAGYRGGNKCIWKLNSSGALVWDYDTGAAAFDLAVDGSGNVYVAGERSGNKSVWKLNSSGALVWDYDTGAAAFGIALNGSGEVHVLGNNGSGQTVWILNSGGSLSTSFPVGGGAYSNNKIAIDADGNIYVTGIRASSKSIWEYDAFGSLVWDYDTGDATTGVTIFDDALYVGSDGVYKFDLSSKDLLWYYDTSNGLSIAVIAA